MYSERVSIVPHAVAWRSVTRPGSETRVLPDGCLDLIWQDGAVFVAGPDTVAEITTAATGSRMFALRFADGTGAGVLGLPADELVDREVPLEHLWPAAEVRRLSEASDPMAALEEVALRRFRPPGPAVAAVVAGLRAGRPVGAIADSCGLSPRHLLRISKTAFGYGPKVLDRILRFQRAVALARGDRPFAEVAAVTGYTDQAHLAREVKALAGVPLRALV